MYQRFLEGVRFETKLLLQGKLDACETGEKVWQCIEYSTNDGVVFLSGASLSQIQLVENETTFYLLKFVIDARVASGRYRNGAIFFGNVYFGRD